MSTQSIKKISEIKDEIQSTQELSEVNELKINLLEAMFHTVCLSDFLKDTSFVEYAYSSFLFSNKITLKECDENQLALLSNSLIGSLLKNYL